MTGEKLLELLEYADEELIVGSQWMEADPDSESMRPRQGAGRTGRRKKGQKKWFALLLVAVMAAGMAVGVVAENRNDVNVALMHFMGLDGGAAQLEDGTVKWEMNVPCDGVDYLQKKEGIAKTCTFTSAESIGDEQAVYVRLNTDYDVPEDFNEQTDYFLPKNHQLYLESPAAGIRRNKAQGYGSTLTTGEEDGKLYFLLSVEDAKDINCANVTLEIEDIVLYHDLGMDDEAASEPEQLAFAGKWNLQWTFSYHSHSKTRHLHKQIANDGNPFVVTKAVVSPLGIHIEGRRLRKQSRGEITIQITGVNLKDGTFIDLGESDQTGTRSASFFEILQGYNNCAEEGILLNASEVYSIIINGEEVVL